jgi:hypothetical protein
MEYVVVIVTLLLVMWLITSAPDTEGFSSSLGFQSISSASPVPYGLRPNMSYPGRHIRRWRTAVPSDTSGGTAYIQAPNWPASDAGLASEMPVQKVIPRTVADDTWARTYAPGIGFQLG